MESRKYDKKTETYIYKSPPSGQPQKYYRDHGNFMDRIKTKTFYI